MISICYRSRRPQVRQAARGDMKNWTPFELIGGSRGEWFEGSWPAVGRTAEGAMRTPDEVAAMVRLKGLGWGIRRIAAEFGCSHETVRRYVAAGGWVAYRKPKAPARGA